MPAATRQLKPGNCLIFWRPFDSLVVILSQSIFTIFRTFSIFSSYNILPISETFSIFKVFYSLQTRNTRHITNSFDFVNIGSLQYSWSSSHTIQKAFYKGFTFLLIGSLHSNGFTF
ncbi:hypothetical protein BU17DRAFT_63594 [Hysterangium stoloniferum]|nr:hypothetical protein BU17DRAFT_63594 [Hysterangium stoloniferum]